MLETTDPIFRCTKNGSPLVYQSPFRSVDTWLADLGRRFDTKPAVIFHDVDRGERTVIAYSELRDLVGRIAAALARHAGVRPGGAIAYALANRPDALLLNLAAMWLGAKSVPLDLRHDPLERMRYKIVNAGCDAVVVPGEDDTNPAATGRSESLAGLGDDCTLLSLGPHPSIGADLSALASQSPARLPRAAQASPSAPCSVLYTSGTTGQPKGVVLTLRAMCANALGIIDWLQLDASDRLNLVLPLHHINSTVFALSTLLAGGTVILNSRYSVSRFWKTIVDERATASSIVPTIMLDLLGRQQEFAASRYDTRFLKKIMIGSAPVPGDAAMRFVETFGVPLIQGYGSTETSLRVTGVPVGLPPCDYEHVLAENAVGVELSHCNVRIDGANRPGDEGEILVRGPVVAQGYLNEPEATSEVFSGGWLHTGDLGTYEDFDDRRFFFMRGRLKEIIIKGGVNLSPVAIENAVIGTFPEILGCYVVGISDGRMQEEIAAAIVVPSELDDASAHCLAGKVAARAQAGTINDLSTYESPKFVVPFRRGELPTTSTGKVQRTVLREHVARRLAAAANETSRRSRK